jgi:uncharacterized membrane protein YdbT with pleckstrin-like domain
MRALVERLLRLPPPPSPPPGDEASARTFRAAPKYFQYRLVAWVLHTFLHLAGPLSALTIFIMSLSSVSGRGLPPAPRVLLIAPLVACLVIALIILIRLLELAVLRLDYERRWYLVTDRSLRIREGIWVVREMTITFANIQNLGVSQGPIQRLLGLFDLRVETAGGGGSAPQPGKARVGLNLHSACFRGIANAAEVKELIQQRLRALKDSGLGDHDERPAAPATTHAMIEALRAVHAEARLLRAAV